MLLLFSHSVMSDSLWPPWIAADQASLSFTISWSLLKFMSVKLVMSWWWVASWSFSFSNSPLSEYSGLISSRIDWFDLIAVQKTLKSLLQHHNLKASILQHSAFFMIQLSHLYMTTGKTTALTMWTFVSKVMCLLLNMDVKHLSVSWLQSLSALILEPKKIKCHFSHFFSFYLPWIDGTRCLDLSFFFVFF